MLMRCLNDLQRAIRGEEVTTKIKKVRPLRRFMLVGGVAAAIILIAGFALLTKSHTPTAATLQVPNVVGLNRFTSTRALYLISQLIFKPAHPRRFPKAEFLANCH